MDEMTYSFLNQASEVAQKAWNNNASEFCILIKGSFTCFFLLWQLILFYYKLIQAPTMLLT